MVKVVFRLWGLKFIGCFVVWSEFIFFECFVNNCGSEVLFFGCVFLVCYVVCGSIRDLCFGFEVVSEFFSFY